MSGDELQSAFLADPFNEALRRVLMDALLEVNHPRAQLWLMKEDDSEAFIAAHADELLGPLAGVLEPGFQFSRGWLQRATLKHAAHAGHPLWATVEALDARGDSLVSKHPVMKSLRTLINSAAPVHELTSPRLTRLLGHHVSYEDAVALSSVNTLPRLLELQVYISVDDVGVLLPRAPALQSLHVDLVDATPELAPSVLEDLFRTGIDRMGIGFFDGRLVLKLWRRGSTYDWRSTRDFDGASDDVRQRLDESHRFLTWQLRALGVVS
ncbi:MAG: hypothetical protein ACO1OB_16040 [Archangium sp.]